jgi:signal transduction histidine kinase
MSKFNDKHRLEVSITDTGVGIPDSDVKMFWQVLSSGGPSEEQISYGAGLGLNFNKKYHWTYLMAEIIVESKLNIGTVSFYLLLEPLSTDFETHFN